MNAWAFSAASAGHSGGHSGGHTSGHTAAHIASNGHVTPHTTGPVAEASGVRSPSIWSLYTGRSSSSIPASTYTCKDQNGDRCK
jgi:hypothetical protein